MNELKQTWLPFSLLEFETSGVHALMIRVETHSGGKTSRGTEGAEGLGSRLTLAEEVVARAAVAGLSNREIAQQRGSAPRTVAEQLRSVYRKLGISSRTELATLIDMVV